MRQRMLLLGLFTLCLTNVFAQYTPIAVTGFTNDIIADGTGTTAAATTDLIMDGASNNINYPGHYLFTKEFALASGFSDPWGLPNDYKIVYDNYYTNSQDVYQINPTGANVLHLGYFNGKGSNTGTLTLVTPTAFSGISLAVTGTEQESYLNITYHFEDGTTSSLSYVDVPDWYGYSWQFNAIVQGFGRIQSNAPFPFTSAFADNQWGYKPQIFAVNIDIPCGKKLTSIDFENTSASNESNRAFIFAVSGIVAPAGAIPPIINNDTICTPGGSVTLTVTNPQPDVTYDWFTDPNASTSFYTGTSYTTSVSKNITYYTKVSGCPTLVPVTVTVQDPPLPPSVTSSTDICPSTDGIIYIDNPDASLQYQLFSDSVGGTAIASGADSIITPALTTTGTYYVGGAAGNCPSAVRTPVDITVLPLLTSPAVQATATTTTSITFSWPAVTGATGYLVSVDGGAFVTPSSGATGTSHEVTGLSYGQTVNIVVKAIAAVECESNTGKATAITGSDLVFVPNVFTPNGDGKNDVLLVYGTIIQSMHFQVFNQWGEKIFESSNQGSGWDGIWKGTLQPTGVYVYTLRVTTTGGNIIDKKGAVTLVR